MKLLEIIPARDTADEVVQFMKTFGENILEKSRYCKGYTDFIANRIGTYGLLVTLKEMMKSGYSVGEVDSVTGPLIGRPKSATFRTLDVVGLDVFVHVANNVKNNVEAAEEKEIFTPPAFMETMLEKGWLGAKTGQGFYLKKGKEILELNPETLEYEQRNKLKTPSTEMAKQQKGTKAKLKTLIYSDDRAGKLLWNIFAPTLIYSAELLKEIADDVVAIDNAMKWGFGWEQGPFESWDAIGVEKSVERMEKEGLTVPGWQRDVECRKQQLYKEENGTVYYYDNGEYKPIKENEKIVNINLLKKQKGVIKKNAGASLIDIGDGVALLEFHSPNNALGLDSIKMINQSIDEVEKNYKGLVIANQGKNFCVGANIALMLMEAQDENFFELDLVIRQFQQAMMRIKYSAKPVVAAPHQMALGGGAEVCLPAARIQASPETYIGLVEVGVGLIPGGGGTKELYIKLLNSMPKGSNLTCRSTNKCLKR